jgi:hypothetical protein
MLMPCCSTCRHRVEPAHATGEIRCRRFELASTSSTPVWMTVTRAFGDPGLCNLGSLWSADRMLAEALA